MNKAVQTVSLGFTRELFPRGIHMCLIFDRDDERQEVVAEYLAAGIRQGEQVRYFTDTTSSEDVCAWLSGTDVEIPKAREKGHFNVIKAGDSYYPNGKFNPQATVNGLFPRYDQAKKDGYSGVRSCGEMTWTLKGIPGADRIIEYEVLLNTIDVNFSHSGMCQYDARLFDGATLFNVLKVHPWMVVRGKIVQNPYYISPQEFLANSKSTQQ